MTGKIQGSGGAPPDQRRYKRLDLPVDTRAVLKDAGGNELDVGVMDLSGGGAGLSTDVPFDNNAFVELHIEGMDPIPGRVARKYDEGMGVEFDLNEGSKKDMEEEVRKFRLTIARENS